MLTSFLGLVCQMFFNQNKNERHFLRHQSDLISSVRILNLQQQCTARNVFLRNETFIRSEKVMCRRRKTRNNYANPNYFWQNIKQFVSHTNQVFIWSIHAPPLYPHYAPVCDLQPRRGGAFRTSNRAGFCASKTTATQTQNDMPQMRNCRIM